MINEEQWVSESVVALIREYRITKCVEARSESAEARLESVVALIREYQSIIRACPCNGGAVSFNIRY